MTWTPITNPTSDTWTQIPNAAFPNVTTYTGGEPIGLLLALTYSTIIITPTDPWTPVANPTVSTWVSIPNAT
jgi:hypothetical protein